MPLGSVEGALDVLADIGGAIIGAPAQLVVNAITGLKDAGSTVDNPQAAGEAVAEGATSGGAAGPRASGGGAAGGAGGTGEVPEEPAGMGASVWPWLLGLGAASVVGWMVYKTVQKRKRRG